MLIPRVLTIAGSDPSGGAGLQADLKTFHAFGCYGMAVVTSLTAQNTLGVRAVHTPPPAFVCAQLDAVFDDCRPVAVKIGMLADAATIEAVASVLETHPHVPQILDPVMVATSGDRLLGRDAEEVLVSRLLPMSRLVTPNQAETHALTDIWVNTPDDAERAAGVLMGRGARAVLIKGGDVAGGRAVDVLFRHDAGEPIVFSLPRVAVAASHGTGCTLSSAIAALLARDHTLAEAVQGAKAFVHRGLEAAFPVGRGAIPVNHLVPAFPERT